MLVTMRPLSKLQLKQAMSIMGRKGGMARVSKGIGKQTPERRREIAMMGVAARRRKKDNA